MAGERLTEQDEAISLSNNDLFYVVDQSASTDQKSKKIRKDRLANTLNVTGGSSAGKRLISGGLVWVSGLTYESVNLVYEINGLQFTITDGTQITLDAAPTTGSDQRIDLIYGDDSGSLAVSKGTEAVSPTANTLLSYQLQLKLVLLDTNGTEPENVDIRSVYLEDAGQPTEFGL